MRFAMAFLSWSFLAWSWSRFGVLKKLKPGGAITQEVSRLKKDFGPAVSKLKNSATDSAADLPFTVPEVAAEVGHWLSYLGAERRMSAKTVDAYQRDVRHFLDFLAMHLGSRVTLAGLRDFATHDVCAFMSHRRSNAARGRAPIRSLAIGYSWRCWNSVAFISRADPTIARQMHLPSWAQKAGRFRLASSNS